MYRVLKQMHSECFFQIIFVFQSPLNPIGEITESKECNILLLLLKSLIDIQIKEFIVRFEVIPTMQI